MDITRKEETILEDETYHLIVDEALENRLAALGTALASEGDDGVRRLGLAQGARPRAGYRIVLSCTRED